MCSTERPLNGWTDLSETLGGLGSQINLVGGDTVGI